MASRLLLDTHAALFWWGDSRNLSAAAAERIAEADIVLVSAASAWEIATKHRLGRLGDIGDPAESFRRLVHRNGFVELDVSVDHALMAGGLPGDHRDPFDRIIAAQGIMEKAVVITRDRQVAGLGCEVLW